MSNDNHVIGNNIPLSHPGRPTLLSLSFLFCILTFTSLTWAQDPCHALDDGSGRPALPPAGCKYISPEEVYQIIDGLPPGSSMELEPSHRGFMCFPDPGNCGQPGGPLGGEIIEFDATLDVRLRGTGELAHLNRFLSIPIAVQMAAGPIFPNVPTQTFPTEILYLDGRSFGDQDFAELAIQSGAILHVPSPGQTTLTDLGNGVFRVDSFFDLSYQISFVGAPGGELEGLAGTTQGMIRIVAVDDPPPPDKFFNDGFEEGDNGKAARLP